MTVNPIFLATFSNAILIINQDTQRFVDDLEKFFTANFGRQFLEGKEPKLGGSEDGSNKADEEDKMEQEEEEEENQGVYGDL